MVAEEFEWTIFYMEFADKLLEYKNNRKELKRLFETSIKDNDSDVYFDNFPNRNIDDIDPYIIFAFLNKSYEEKKPHIDTKYYKLNKEIKSVFNLKSEVPTTIAGIPFLSRQYSEYLKLVTKNDIEETWIFFEAVIKNDDNIINKKTFVDYFPKMLNHKHLGLITLTMFLYWIKPNDLISFDGHNKGILTNRNIFSNELVNIFDSIEKKKDAQLYLDYCQDLKKEISSNKYPFKNFPELSTYSYNPIGLSNDNDIETDVEKDMTKDFKRNLIYFGAPGTGKSFILNKKKDELLKGYEKNFERVTFHPDYSYANFVGTYKPIIEENEETTKREITYKFVPGPFTRVLVKALNKPQQNHLLIIEEINRANVAGVFGDIFQLLDRKDGKSEFPIQTSEDMKQHLTDVVTNEDVDCDYIEIPDNMYIWATMNSADQGVFFMDSAFKRRWDFEYIKIDNNEESLSKTRYSLDFDDNKVEITWNDLRGIINDELLRLKVNEDRLLGPYFIPDNLDKDEFKDKFKNKVLMYLFEDVLKTKRKDFFSIIPKEGNIKYSELIDEFDNNGVGIFNDKIRNEILKKVGGK